MYAEQCIGYGDKELNRILFVWIRVKIENMLKDNDIHISLKRYFYGNH